LNNTTITIDDGTNNFVLETVKTHVPEVDIDIDIVPVITYPDTTTRNLQLAAESNTGVNGWRLVRFLPPNLGRWYSGNYFTTTNMEVSSSLGTAYDYTNEFMVPFGTYDEIFFSTRDMTYWLRCLKTAVLGTYDNSLRPIISSSSSPTPYSARWYSRETSHHEPWITIADHNSAPQVKVYGENGIADTNNILNDYGGMCVFVRTSTDTISSSIIPAMPVYEAQTTVTQNPLLPADSTNLVAHYKFDGDFTDSSGNGYDLTNHSSSTQSTHVIDGEAVEFDNSDYLEFPTTINPYTIWNGNGITFSFWVRFTAHKNWARLIDFQGGTSQDTGVFISVKAYPTGNQNALHISVNDTKFQYSNWSDSLITTLNVWHHIVFSIDTSGNWNVYLNNTRINNTENENIPNKTYNIRYINKSAYSSDGQWEGQMDNFRIYDKVLSAYEIDILANNKIENPDYNILTFEYQGPSYPVIDADAASLVAWYKFDDTNDSNPTSTKYNLTNNAVTFVDGKINKCALFDHSSDLLSASTINLSNLLGTEFTFSLWVKVKSGISAYGQVFQYFQDNNNNIYFRRQNANRFAFWIWQNGYLGGGVALDMPNYIVDQWNHYVITYTGTEAKAYVNGILHQTDAKDGTEFNIGNSTLRIGDRNDLDQHFYGEIDDFRIYNKALSATEISDLYSQYNQTPYTVNFQGESECDILIVGGGGGGGHNGGGGGGGDVLYFQNIAIPIGTYDIKVGKSGTGTGGISNSATTTSGNSSEFYNIIAGGGGAGQSYSYTDATAIANSIAVSETYIDPLTQLTAISKGGNGGVRDSSGSNTNASRGGDGAGGVALNVSDNSGTDGGAGIKSNITGVEIGYGGGGGGRDVSAPESHGIGVDGGATTSWISGAPAIEGRGGGGASENVSGGSGIVIIRYKTKSIKQHPAYDAQWTYHSANPNVHHYGNVGIGTLASETNKLTVKGDINVIGDIYENNNKIAYGWDVYGNSVYNQYGNVGIGTNDPRYALHTTGVIYAGQGITETGSTTWTITSDNRIKENIEKASYDICSENIKNINLYRFNYNTKYVKTTDKNQLGFIAQDVRKYFPKAVKNKTTRFDNDVVPNLLSVDVTQLNYAMYGAVKHIGQDIDAIKEKLGITELPNDVKNQPYFTEVVPFNDPDAELPIVNEEPATN